MSNAKRQCRLTTDLLDTLRGLGFQYFLIDSYEPEFVSGNIELDNFTLVPVRTLPSQEGECGMFAAIDDEIILSWASETGTTVTVSIT